MRRDAERLAEDAMLRDSARAFLSERCPWTHLRRTPEELDRIRGEAAELGWFMMGLPEAAGGAGSDLEQILALIEEAGRALHPESLVADLILAPAVLPPESLLLPLLAEGKTRFCFVRDGVAIAGSRSDAVSLNGTGNLSLGADRATHAIVAVDGDEPALLVVPVPWGTSRVVRLIDGRSAARIVFEGSRSEDGAVLARGAEAREMIALLDDLAATAAVFDAVGAVAGGIELTVDYLNQRRQFGQTLGAFQAVRHKMAEVYCSLETLRSLAMWSAAAIAAKAPERSKAANAAKIGLAVHGLPAAGKMIQVSGGIGVTEEYRIGHVYKRLTVAAGLDGSAETRIEEFATAILGEGEQAR
jgi:alkylation response protein AidB-like acyl-CoA dehydrogenase